MKHRVFVYGTLRQGFSNHVMLEGQAYIGPAEIGEGFCMVSLTMFPGIIRCDSDMTIQGEVYEVDDRCLQGLDLLEGHPTFYERQEVFTSQGPCLTYVLPGTYMDRPVIRSGDWAEWRNDENRSY